MYRLTIGYLYVSFIRLLAVCVSMLILAFTLPFSNGSPFVLLISLAAAVLFLVVGARIIIKYYKFSIKIDKDKFFMGKGSFIIKERYLKLSGLKYVVSLRTPLMWICKTNSLVLFFAGAIVVTPPLSKKQAKHLYSELSHYCGEEDKNNG